MSRRPRRAMGEINVVPYIDVMLVLLIIFMVAAPMINPAQVNLPSMGEASNVDIAPLEIIIKADRTWLLRDRQQPEKERVISLTSLVAAVKEKQSQNPNQAVVIAADKSVRYEEVLKVMDALQTAQINKVGLLVEPRK